MFGDDPLADGPPGSADERDDTDRGRESRGGDGDERWWREQRPPHHDRG